MRAALGLMLEHQGASAVAVGSVQAAQEILENLQVDVLVCNLHLSDGDGFQVLQAWQNARPELTAVAIALTADSAEIVSQQAIAQGFQACLTKPFEAATLMRAIAQHRRLA